MNVNQILKTIGLSENEISIYLAALKVGASSAQSIAKIANQKRTTTYSVLKGLVEKGLVGVSIERGKQRFVAEPPEKLIDILEETTRKLKESLPELKTIYNERKEKPKILFFEGKNAIQNIYDDTLREKPKVILEWNTNAYFDYPTVDPTYIAKRMKLGILAKRIAGSSSKWHTKHKRYDKSELAETLIVPKDKFWPEVEVNIYKNKVAFLSYADDMSVIIESKAIARAMRQAYNLSWEGAKTYDIK